MTLRFYILLGHYRNPLDFSNQALQDAEKAFAKISDAYLLIRDMEFKEENINTVTEKEINTFEQDNRDAMNDDFNTAIVIANMFKAASIINQFNAAGKTAVSKTAFDNFKKAYIAFYSDVLGLVPESTESTGGKDFSDLVGTLIHARTKAKQDKDFKLSDTLRDIISEFGELKDTPQGATFKYGRKK